MEEDGIIQASRLYDLLKDSPEDVTLIQGVITPTDQTHFASERLPNASAFDVGTCSDATSGLPKTLPKPDAFRNYVTRLGVRNSSLVAIYDAPSDRPVAAARIWWMFRVFGHRQVVVLDGGFNAWKELGLPTETKTLRSVEQAENVRYDVLFNEELFDAYDDVLRNKESRQRQLIDTRTPESFTTSSISGAKNVFFRDMWVPETPGRFKGKDDIRAAFRTSGVSLEESTIAYCNTGVTSCTVILGAFVCGKKDVSNYDGSWTEWSKKN